MTGTAIPVVKELPPGIRQMLGDPVVGVQPYTKVGGFVRVTDGGKK